MIKYLFLSLVILTACNSTDSNEILLTDGNYFQLNNGEEISTKDQETVDYYFSLIEDTTIQVPLYKSIVASDYNIYLGIPFNTEFSSMVTAHNDLAEKTINKETSENKFYIQYEKDSLLITKYIEKFEEDLILVMIENKLNSKLDSVNSFKSINNRIVRD